jgi:hypothetical protein
MDGRLKIAKSNHYHISTAKAVPETYLIETIELLIFAGSLIGTADSDNWQTVLNYGTDISTKRLAFFIV